MGLIIYTPKLCDNITLEALKNKNNDEINNSYKKLNLLSDKCIRENIVRIYSYNNYLYYNILNKSLDIYFKKNKFRIYKKHSKFNFYDSFIPFKIYNLINNNSKTKIKFDNKLFNFFIHKEKDIFRKKELYYNDDKIGKRNGIIATYFLHKGLLPMKFFLDSKKLFFKKLESYIKSGEKINISLTIKNDKIDKITDTIQIILNKIENFNLNPPLLTALFSKHRFSFLLIDIKPEKIFNSIIINLFIDKGINNKAIEVNYLAKNSIKSQKEL